MSSYDQPHPHCRMFFGFDASEATQNVGAWQFVAIR